MSSSADGGSRPPQEGAPTCSSLFRAVGLVTGDMRLCREWAERQAAGVRLLDWTFRGVAQVVFVNNPLSGLLVTAGLFLQDPWWALSGLLATLVSTGSAYLLGQNGEATSAGLHGYNGTLIGILMAVFSAKGSWYWWLLLPNVFLSMLCPVVSSALSSVASKWDLPILTLPFNILVCLHVAATGANHPYFPQADMRPKDHLHPANDSAESLDVARLFLSVPVGVGQVYGCSSPWTGSLVLLALLLSAPTICAQAMWGSAVGVLSGEKIPHHLHERICTICLLRLQLWGLQRAPWHTTNSGSSLTFVQVACCRRTRFMVRVVACLCGAGVALAAPHEDIYSGLWGYNSALSCIAIGGVFYVITWKTQLLALTCALFCAYMTAAISKLMSVLALPACTWPFCLSTLIFLLISSETPAIGRLPLSAVSYPEENRRYRTRLEASEKAPLGRDEVPFGADSSCSEALCH